MVEGETLLVLLLLGRCLHPAAVPQPPKKSAVSAKKTRVSDPASSESRRTTQAPRHLKGNLGQNPRHQCWNHVEPHGNRIAPMRLAQAKKACASISALLEPP